MSLILVASSFLKLAYTQSSNESVEVEERFCDIVYFETEVIERQNSISDLKDACEESLANLVEHFGPPRDDMFLEVLCKTECESYHNSYLELLEESGCTCQEAGSYDRYCYENRMELICDMPQLGICNNFGEAHETDPCQAGCDGFHVWHLLIGTLVSTLMLLYR
jgi:hypothetical protein